MLGGGPREKCNREIGNEEEEDESRTEGSAYKKELGKEEAD